MQSEISMCTHFKARESISREIARQVSHNLGVEELEAMHDLDESKRAFYSLRMDLASKAMDRWKRGY